MITITRILLLLITLISISSYQLFTSRNLIVRNIGLEGLKASNKDAQRDEQYKIQQEILARRKNKTSMKQYFEGVEEKRKSESELYKQKLQYQASRKADVLDEWKAAKSKGQIKPLGYENVPNRNTTKLGLTFVVPGNPIGIARYDEGERFDLRLPYAERGYEDPSADVMKNFADGFKSLFFGKGKKEAKKD